MIDEPFVSMQILTILREIEKPNLLNPCFVSSGSQHCDVFESHVCKQRNSANLISGNPD